MPPYSDWCPTKWHGSWLSLTAEHGLREVLRVFWYRFGGGIWLSIDVLVAEQRDRYLKETRRCHTEITSVWGITRAKSVTGQTKSSDNEVRGVRWYSDHITASIYIYVDMPHRPICPIDRPLSCQLTETRLDVC